MNSVTKMSVEGAVVIPLEVRERLHLEAGAEFEVSEKAGQVVFKPRLPAGKKPKRRFFPTINREEFLARLPKYEGPPVTQEDIEKAIDQEMLARWSRKISV